MPIVVDPENETLTALLATLPTGAHGVLAVPPMQAWLAQHTDEYVVVLGPHLALEEAVGVCESLRVTRPTVSVVLVRDELDTTTLTSAMKAGARDVVQTDDLPAVEAAVERAYQLLLALRGPAGAAHVGRVVTVFSPKGGVGKTTMAVNLALALTDKGARKVCLVDLDLAFGDVAITMQLFPTHSIEQAVGAEDSLDGAMLEGLLTRHHESLMVLAGPDRPDVRERITAPLVTRVLRTLRETFDYVVVDTAPALDEPTLTALDETDECVVVATLDVPTLKNVKVAMETLEMLDIAEGHRHLLLNRADDAVGLGPDKVEAILGMDVAARVESSIDIAAATNSGTPILLEKPTHQSSTAIRELAARLAGDSVAAPRSTAFPDLSAAQAGEGDRVARRFRLRR